MSSGDGATSALRAVGVTPLCRKSASRSTGRRGCDLLRRGDVGWSRPSAGGREARQQRAETKATPASSSLSPPWGLLAGAGQKVQEVLSAICFPKLWPGGSVCSPAIRPKPLVPSTPAHTVRAILGRGPRPHRACCASSSPAASFSPSSLAPASVQDLPLQLSVSEGIAGA